MPMRNPTRKIHVGTSFLGGDAPVLIQTMCATKTSDINATVQSVEQLQKAGAVLIRLAVDNVKDAQAIQQIRQRTTANLSVDLHENFRMAELVAPYVDKIRYNPGHLHHLDPEISWQEKVRWLAEIAQKNDCALRIGINCGSIPAAISSDIADSKFNDSSIDNSDFNGSAVLSKENRSEKIRSDGNSSQSLFNLAMMENALEHAAFLDSLGFVRYCVSIKDSDPVKVVAANRYFAARRPDIPLHLGVTEAGMPPDGILKSRYALETLLAEGIGDTLRVSLTVESDRKTEEVEAGFAILRHIKEGTGLSISDWHPTGLNIVSCPSCSRVQNRRFVALAQEIKKMVEFANDYPIKIAVMGCRVNGPGETDDADIGVWCGADHVNLKQKDKSSVVCSYEEIVPKIVSILQQLCSSMSNKSL